MVNVCEGRGDALTCGSCRGIGLFVHAVGDLGNWSVESGDGCGG